MGFVNPYNFAPLPKEVRRGPVPGHTGPPRSNDEQLYSGTIDVEWTLVTPLALPPGDIGKEWLSKDGSMLRVPGSSIKGAVRSLHEALFNGCLRVFDSEFVPVYRLPATAWTQQEQRDWRLAQVVETADGRPQRLRLAGETTWLDAYRLQNQLGTLPTTGDVIQVDLASRRARAYGTSQRYELNGFTVHSAVPRATVSDNILAARHLDGVIFLVTHLGTRAKAVDVFWAAGELTQEFYQLGEQDAPAVAAFIASAQGVDDRRSQRRGARRGAAGGVRFESAVHKGTTLARRVRQNEHLAVGDIVWVHLAGHGGPLQEIRLAQIWRGHGAGPAGDRVPESLKACQPGEHEQRVCLTCATFGTIDAEAPKGTSTGYRGHVTFSSATANLEGRALASVSRAPLASPRPGSGGFYLDGLNDHPHRSQGDVAAHWGSQADKGATLRGRKFYWHSDPDAQSKHWQGRGAQQARPRYEAPGADGQPRGIDVDEVKLVPAGTTLTGQLSFDRLPLAAVEALLAALAPQQVAKLIPDHKHRKIAVRLGGGKPLGLGSATTKATVRLQALEQRYSSKELPSGMEPLSLGSIKRILDRVGPAGAVWEHLFRLLDLDALGEDAHLVAYPPSAAWNAFGTKAFAESYKFFGRQSGLVKEKSIDPLTQLPKADAARQVIDWNP